MTRKKMVVKSGGSKRVESKGVGKGLKSEPKKSSKAKSEDEKNVN